MRFTTSSSRLVAALVDPIRGAVERGLAASELSFGTVEESGAEARRAAEVVRRPAGSERAAERRGRESAPARPSTVPEGAGGGARLAALEGAVAASVGGERAGPPGGDVAAPARAEAEAEPRRFEREGARATDRDVAREGVDPGIDDGARGQGLPVRSAASRVEAERRDGLSEGTGWPDAERAAARRSKMSEGTDWTGAERSAARRGAAERRQERSGGADASGGARAAEGHGTEMSEGAGASGAEGRGGRRVGGAESGLRPGTERLAEGAGHEAADVADGLVEGSGRMEEAGVPVASRRAPVLRREEARAAEQVSGALRPVLDGAAALTDGALAAPDGPRVANHFDVHVLLGGQPGAVDPEALRAALIELLREAARRHGMEVG